METDGGGPMETALGLELMRSLAEQELARADAARVRSRQAFALAAAIFTVVQTVAFGSFVTKLAQHGHRTDTLINHTAWAALALGVCAVAMLIAELPIRSSNMTPELIQSVVREKKDKAAAQFLEDYALIVETHRLANRIRFRLATLTQALSVVTIALVVWELLVALHASLSL